MNKFVLFYFFLIIITSPVSSQTTESKEAAKQHIHALKSGVLLVRLYGNQRKIEALKKVGFNLHANNADAEHKKRNKKIIKAFDQHYNFSQVYFFYLSNSKEITKGNFENILFSDTLFKVNEIKTFDSAVYVLNSRYAYYKVKKKLKNGYTILKQNLQRVEKPFPFYIKEKTLFSRRSTDKMVQLLNKQLTDYYNTCL